MSALSGRSYPFGHGVNVKVAFTFASTAVVLGKHLPRPGIRTPDLSALSPKVVSIPLRHRVNVNVSTKDTCGGTAASLLVCGAVND